MSLVQSAGGRPEFRPVARRSVVSRRARGSLWGYFFVAPSLLMFLLFSLYPMLDSVVLSFQRYRLTGREWVGLRNYQRLLDEPAFLTVLKNTLLYAVAIVPFGVALSLVMATLIYRLPSIAQIFFKSAFYLPVVTSGVVLSLIWLYLYDPAFGLINFMLAKVGLEPVLWLADPRFSLISVVIMFHASHWGGSIILLTASMGGIPKDLYEAARLDGASFFRQSISITVPLLKPAITYVAIIGTIASLQIFAEVFLMTRGGPNYATTNLVYSIYEYGFIRFDFGRASAVAVVLLLLTAGIAVAQFRLLRSNVEY
ncbi:MAG: multiple sugar transport system permease protein [Thermomicrobiales bacterium]|jgi:multiple sugar transport system permease protein|nr:multiple sugar transport system permease protein [Thermomicrobiales bacterium]